MTHYKRYYVAREVKNLSLESNRSKPLAVQQLCKEAHQNAVEHGFWDNELNIIGKIHANQKLSIEEKRFVVRAFRAQRLMLIVSELGEAMEALRKDDFENYEEELSDNVIRVADTCGGESINLEDGIRRKMEYNKSRPRLHGKKC